MTRGKKPEAAIADAKKFAEKMGYWWQESTNPELAYDFLIFKPANLRVVKVRQTRYRIDPDTIYEDLMPDNLKAVRALPFPAWLPRARSGSAPSTRGSGGGSGSMSSRSARSGGGGRMGTRTRMPGEVVEIPLTWIPPASLLNPPTLPSNTIPPLYRGRGQTVSLPCSFSDGDF